MLLAAIAGVAAAAAVHWAGCGAEGRGGSALSMRVRPVIEARWGSKPLALAGELRPR
jgi:hypothetical protein